MYRNQRSFKRERIQVNLMKGPCVATAIAASLFAVVASAHAETVIKVAYSADYFMSTPAMATQWFTAMKEGVVKAYPGVTLQLEPIPTAGITTSSPS
jgi:multiple sugar transport system substrate-binding protein